jgi:hypothetical protein
MRRGLLCLLTLTAALPAAARNDPGPPPVPPPVPEPVTLNQDPHFLCQVERNSPDGAVSAARQISEAGIPGPPLGMWTKQLTPDGISLTSGWELPAPAGYSFVQLSWQNTDSRRTYRFRVQRDLPNGENQLLFETRLTRAPDGMLVAFTDWAPLAAMLAGAADPRILIVRSDGRIVRSDPIDPEMFGRVAATAAGLQPELEALVADYRNRCPFIQPGVVY